MRERQRQREIHPQARSGWRKTHGNTHNNMLTQTCTRETDREREIHSKARLGWRKTHTHTHKHAHTNVHHERGAETERDPPPSPFGMEENTRKHT
jgi:hypothetical protein